MILTLTLHRKKWAVNPKPTKLRVARRVPAQLRRSNRLNSFVT
jgi:hypothetical protein